MTLWHLSFVRRSALLCFLVTCARTVNANCQNRSVIHTHVVVETMNREDQAAAKIQALQRGRKARQEVQQVKHREEQAATKIQALQRGRTSRKVAEQKRKELAVFSKPPRMQTASYIDVGVSLAAMRQRSKTWDHFLELLAEADLVDSRFKLDVDNMLYSTTVQPNSFPNAFSRKVFEAVVAADAARVLATKRRAEHEAIEAAKPPPPPPAAPRDDGDDVDDEDKRPAKTKKQLREEAEQRKADKERLKQVLEAEYDAQCRFQKLVNVLKLDSLRIPILASE